ncbi:MAG: hypothetical protein ACR2P3_06905, partial [Geminicoccaceae bacterium]
AHTTKLRANYYSNEGISAGDNHAQALIEFLKFFNGGNDSLHEQSGRRFMRRIDDEWIASED